MTRNDDIERRFKNGETLQAIGEHYGISRERVRQLLAKRGVTRTEGGAAKRKREAAAQRLSDRETAMMRRYGLTIEEWWELRGEGPYHLCPFPAYRSQRQGARRRGIEWYFTLKSWWAVWRDSGKWDQRGTGRGYQMARYGDTGPYAPWNVEIITGIENITSYWIRQRTGNPRKVWRKWGIENPRVV